MSKSAQNKLLFLIAAFSSRSDDWVNVFSSPLPRLPGFPKRDKTIKKALHDLLASGRLEYKKQKETILIRPTKKAFRELSESYPIYYNFISGWDGRFRLVMYNIPERQRKKRDAIRYLLKNLHFNRFQDSLWISPHNLTDLLVKRLRKLGLESSVQIFEAKLFHGRVEDFLAGIFGLEKINKEYQKVVGELKKTISQVKSRRRRVEIFRQSFLSFQKIIESDPGLPRELLPKEWYGTKVREMLKKLQKLI